MTRWVVGGCFLVCIVSAIPACGGGGSGGGSGTGMGGNYEARLCARADECNFLQGMSASECTSDVKSCTAELSGAEMQDWSREIEECLQYATCSGFDDCYWDVPWC